ncbi:MAG: NAD(P)H-dependent oxidoreductase subunit E [Clostridiales bacterium]|nr:NAD(P)H-dependent oxidoreductase subunit E [Clostridiales bacterium]
MGCNENGADREKYAELDQFIASLPTTKGELIRVLHRAQGIFGYLPKEVQVHVAKKLDLPVSKVYGVVSFYSFFTMKPKGKYDVSVCLGTACYVRGADKILEALTKKLGIGVGDTTDDAKFSLRTLRCVGACGLAPVVMINNKVYGRVTPDMVEGIIAECE